MLDTLCDKYAPKLSKLLCSSCIPEPQHTVLVEWVDDLAAADPSSGFDFEVLEQVLPALNTAFLASFAFAGVPAQGSSLRECKIDLELTDRGGGLLVQCTRTAAGLLAVGLYGNRGVALVARADKGLRDAIDAIMHMIAQRQ